MPLRHDFRMLKSKPNVFGALFGEVPSFIPPLFFMISFLLPLLLSMISSLDSRRPSIGTLIDALSHPCTAKGIKWVIQHGVLRFKNLTVIEDALLHYCAISIGDFYEVNAHTSFYKKPVFFLMFDQKRNLSKLDMLRLGEHWAVYCMDVEKGVDFHGCCGKQRKIILMASWCYQKQLCHRRYDCRHIYFWISSEKTVIATSPSLVNFNCG